MADFGCASALVAKCRIQESDLRRVFWFSDGLDMEQAV